MNPQRLSPAAKGSLYVAAGAVCISFSPLFVRVVDVGPTAVSFYRLLWGGAALMLVALLRREPIVPGKPLFLLMLAAAFFFTGDLACWHQSIHYIGPGLATIITNFQVFFLAIIGVLFFRENMSLRLAVSIPLALGGMWMLLEVNFADMPGEVSAGILLGLATAAFYTAYILTLRQSRKCSGHLPAIANMAVISLLGMCISGVLALIQGQSLFVASPRDNALLMVYGVGCQGLGWFLLSKGLPLLPASRAGLLMLTQPTLAFVWDILLLNRPTGPVGYAGAVLALFAIALGVSAPSKGQRAPSFPEERRARPLSRAKAALRTIRLFSGN